MLFPSRVRPGLADGTITDDPRLGLRAEADLDDDERAEVERRLRRLPWAIPTLRLIGERPATVSTELAAEMGVERAQFKQRVRRLKALGLTVSLEVGYRLSPRGEAVLGAWREETPCWRTHE